ncbi:hypothetical protein GW17_00022387 [Ensete ventricosum]|nr:hypothetical protein GW17_00022387 [Ensete ventricosum]
MSRAASSVRGLHSLKPIDSSQFPKLEPSPSNWFTFNMRRGEARSAGVGQRDVLGKEEQGNDKTEYYDPINENAFNQENDVVLNKR